MYIIELRQKKFYNADPRAKGCLVQSTIGFFATFTWGLL